MRVNSFHQPASRILRQTSVVPRGTSAASTKAISTGSTPLKSTATERDPDAARGVIRLLQEGHFKGVADVRLRINFFDEIQGLQTAADGTHIQGVIEQLAADLQTAFAAFAENNPLEEPAAGAFAELQAMLEGTVQGVPDKDAQRTVAEQLSAAFEAFMTGVATLFPAPEPVPDENESPATPLQELTAALQDLLQAALDQLNAPPSVLPPISEPSGSGGAYAKFLAMYQDLLAAPQDLPDNQVLDVSL